MPTDRMADNIIVLNICFAFISLGIDSVFDSFGRE